MKAVLLAGGRGTRLAPHTASIPKALVPIGGRPIVEILARQLARHGITELTLAVGHLAGAIEAELGDGAHLGVRLRYSREERPLGTAGPLALIPGLDAPFLALNADLLTDLDFTELGARHAAGGAAATLVVHERRVEVQWGVAELDADDRLVALVEKPTLTVLASAGIYVLHPRALAHVTRGEVLDMPELLGRLLHAGERVLGHRFAGYWRDVGRPLDHAQACADLEALPHLAQLRAP